MTTKRLLPKTLFALLALSAGLCAQTSYEAEKATLVGATTATTQSGYSGTGYVYLAQTGSITFPVDVAAKGFYKLVLRVSTPMGNKNQKLYVNGAFSSTLQFPANAAWFDFQAGNVPLNAGRNTIQIQPDWGYMHFDRITLTQVPPHDYTQVDTALIDPQANDATRKVFAFLRSQYGRHILTGQTDYWDSLVAIAGKTPVVRAFDMQNYSEHNPWHDDWSSWDDGTVQRAIEWHRSTRGKGIVSFQWHWFSPMGGTLRKSIFYTKETEFDIGRAVTPGTAEYAATVRDIDSIAVQLKRLQDAGIPVLWRPLHEAGGGWFWWGAKGAAPAKALWDLMYSRLTGIHGLHNLIWVWSTPEPDWYPGNAKVDIVGYDSYPGAFVYASQKAVFDQLFSMVGGKKLVAMTENGPIPDIGACIEEDAMWAYFSTWVDFAKTENTAAHVREVYAHSKAITLDEVVDPTTGIGPRKSRAIRPASGKLTGHDLLGRRIVPSVRWKR